MHKPFDNEGFWWWYHPKLKRWYIGCAPQFGKPSWAE